MRTTTEMCAQLRAVELVELSTYYIQSVDNQCYGTITQTRQKFYEVSPSSMSACRSALDAYCANAQPDCDGGAACWDKRRSRWGCCERTSGKRCFNRGHQMALVLELCRAALPPVLPTGNRAAQMVTVIITAAPVASHPALTLVNRSLTSLVLLKLPIHTPILLTHDQPALNAGQGLPSSYEQYLDRLRAFLPRYAANTGYAPRLLLQQMHGNLIGSLVLSLRAVRTTYVLKLEHDVEFIRSVDLPSVLDDMRRDSALKLIRFNHRPNIFRACDRGYFGDPAHNRQLFSNYATEARLSNVYTRTVCFADRVHLTSANYYRHLILTPLVRVTPCVGPETYLQPFVAMDHDKYGTHIFGSLRAQPVVRHLDDPGKRSAWLNSNCTRRDRAIARWCAWFHSTWWCTGGCRLVHRITSRREQRWPFAYSRKMALSMLNAGALN